MLFDMYFFSSPMFLIFGLNFLCCAFSVQDFLSWNEPRIQQLPCQILEPIPLGEGAGIGWTKGVDSMEMPDGSTLYDLVQMGLTSTHAAVGVVVRLRKELSLVKDIPVLIAVDQVRYIYYAFMMFIFMDTVVYESFLINPDSLICFIYIAVTPSV